MSSDSEDRPATFAFVCCQNGCEPAVKRELAEQGWRLAFSRRGFVSLKHPEAGKPLPRGVFVRSAAWSIGLVQGERAEVNIEAVLQRCRAAEVPWPLDRLHVWPRDRVPVGKFDFEPGVDEVSKAVGERLIPALVGQSLLHDHPVNTVAAAGQSVLDVVLVEPSCWSIGWHRVGDHGDDPTAVAPASWPGGVQPLQATVPVVSRAYYKAAEAIDWSGLEMQPGDLAVDVGAAPGGASGRLLELGLKVIGIDPADMDPRILRASGFRHIRARAGDLPRRVFSGAKWLLVDSNVRPDQTLTTVQHIVSHRAATIQGMLLTLKLGEVSQADRIAGWVKRIESWGASQVRVRQLARGKLEVCVAARMPLA